MYVCMYVYYMYVCITLGLEDQLNVYFTYYMLAFNKCMYECMYVCTVCTLSTIKLPMIKCMLAFVNNIHLCPQRVSRHYCGSGCRPYDTVSLQDCRLFGHLPSHHTSISCLSLVNDGLCTGGSSFSARILSTTYIHTFTMVSS